MCVIFQLKGCASGGVMLVLTFVICMENSCRFCQDRSRLVVVNLWFLYLDEIYGGSLLH